MTADTPTFERGCEVSEFKREPRYVVFKIKDIERYITIEDKLLINEVGKAIAVGRRSDGKPPFNAVVIEQDWPEFEPTWAAIEARMTPNSKSEGAEPLLAKLPLD